MPKLPKTPQQIERRYPEVWDSFQQLAEACHDAGPLNERTRRLVKLALAIGAGLEGGTHSAARHAAEGGVTAEEMRHVALLAITTIGFPASMRGLTWMADYAGAGKASKSSRRKP